MDAVFADVELQRCRTAAIKYFTFWVNYARINKVVKGSVDVPLS